MHKIFRETAEELMNNYVLKFGEHEVEPVEIEFYFHMCGEHEDPFIHASIEQICTKGKLYPHSKGRGGVDLTFGDLKHHIIGGILLKSVKIDGDYHVGQTKVKDEVERLMPIEEINKENQLTLKDSKKSAIYHIYTSSRIGLQIKEDEDRGEDAKIKKRFADAPYRFVREDVIKKDIQAKTELHAICKRIKKDESITDYENDKYDKYVKFENEGCFEEYKDC